MDRTDAEQSVLEWTEETIQRINDAGDAAVAAALELAKTRSQSVITMMYQSIYKDALRAAEIALYNDMQKNLTNSIPSVASQLSTDIRDRAISKVTMEINSRVNEAVSAGEELAISNIESLVDTAVTWRVRDYKDALVESVSAMLDNRMVSAGLVLPEVGDVLPKSRGLALVNGNHRFLVRKIGSQLGFSEKWYTNGGYEGYYWGQWILSLVLLANSTAPTADADFPDDISSMPSVFLEAETDPVNTSASVPLYHHGTPFSSGRWYVVTYEKYNAATGKSAKCTYWRSNIDAAVLAAEYRGIDEYLVQIYTSRESTWYSHDSEFEAWL